MNELIANIGIHTNSLCAEWIKSEYNELAFENLSYEMTPEEMKEFFTGHYNAEESRRIKKSLANFYPSLKNVERF